MSALLADWPFKRVPTLSFMEFQDGDRVEHFLGPQGTIVGYDFYAPGYFYVQYDDQPLGPSRIPSTSLEKVDD